MYFFRFLLDIETECILACIFWIRAIKYRPGYPCRMSHLSTSANLSEWSVERHRPGRACSVGPGLGRHHCKLVDSWSEAQFWDSNSALRRRPRALSNLGACGPVALWPGGPVAWWPFTGPSVSQYCHSGPLAGGLAPGSAWGSGGVELLQHGGTGARPGAGMRRGGMDNRWQGVRGASVVSYWRYFGPPKPRGSGKVGRIMPHCAAGRPCTPAGGWTG